MRKRRAFADKELENVMLERELRQRELHGNLSFSSSSSSGLVPVLHPPPPPPLPASPSLTCCLLNKEPAAAGASGYVPVFKYKPLYECDFQFYQFFHLRSRSPDFLRQSSELRRDGEALNSCQGREKKDSPEPTPTPLPSRPILKHPGGASSGLHHVKPTSKPTEIINSNGPSPVSRSLFGSNLGIMGWPDVAAHSRTFEPRSVTAKGGGADTSADQAGPHADWVKGPHGGSARSPAVKPLPFSVEALLRA
ncbi:Doublesex- and mab-3-related transcription factor 2 [Liparis tanakae]|uniref:Doublesex-and mab-3-related transcription factor 2 n=1 Tax=Liparis tanakae TaxID=230148 RepID=A0A4Z2EZW0_9TELE|nr:Doublesex- and mab-3-related transcription factor 2 [Liparis tanakae]